MRRILLSTIGLVLTMTSAGASPLDDLRWSKRVLLVFASADDDGAGTEQRAELAAAPPDALAERDLLVLVVPETGGAEALYGTGGGPFDAGALRAAYDVPAGTPFAVLLVGKDGGVKWRGQRPATAEALFRLIDAMPMRAREMRKG